MAATAASTKMNALSTSDDPGRWLQAKLSKALKEAKVLKLVVVVMLLALGAQALRMSTKNKTIKSLSEDLSSFSRWTAAAELELKLLKQSVEKLQEENRQVKEANQHIKSSRDKFKVEMQQANYRLIKVKNALEECNARRVANEEVLMTEQEIPAIYLDWMFLASWFVLGLLCGPLAWLLFTIVKQECKFRTLKKMRHRAALAEKKEKSLKKHAAKLRKWELDLSGAEDTLKEKECELVARKELLDERQEFVVKMGAELEEGFTILKGVEQRQSQIAARYNERQNRVLSVHENLMEVMENQPQN